MGKYNDITDNNNYYYCRQSLLVVNSVEFPHLSVIDNNLVIFGQTFSGLTNTVTAVKNAQMAESPVLLLGGAAATLLKVCRIWQ